jgi:hypothetical protein
MGLGAELTLPHDLGTTTLVSRMHTPVRGKLQQLFDSPFSITILLQPLMLGTVNERARDN